MLEFYAASGDFTRRLTSVKANGKFSSLKAGPEDYWTVRPAPSLKFPCFTSSVILFGVGGAPDKMLPGLLDGETCCHTICFPSSYILLMLVKNLGNLLPHLKVIPTK